jgi:hypothetical protein
MIPVDHPHEPILDAMGVAHMLDLPGCVPELAGIGPRRPLLQPADVAFVGFGDAEEDVHGLVPSPRLRDAEVIADPVAAGRRALRAVPHRHLVVHFDVDVLDALDLPLADIATYGTGMRLEHVEPLLQDSCRQPPSSRHDRCRSQPGSRPRRNLRPSAVGSARLGTRWHDLRSGVDRCGARRRCSAGDGSPATSGSVLPGGGVQGQ